MRARQASCRVCGKSKTRQPPNWWSVSTAPCLKKTKRHPPRSALLRTNCVKFRAFQIRDIGQVLHSQANGGGKDNYRVIKSIILSFIYSMSKKNSFSNRLFTSLLSLFLKAFHNRKIHRVFGHVKIAKTDCQKTPWKLLTENPYYSAILNGRF